MNFEPLVSVGVINYNNERFVIETLESIKAQTYKNIELVIIDDCSTDNSLHLIKKWLEDYNIPSKLIVNDKNLGIARTFEKLFNNVNGNYLSVIATDDVLMPHKIKTQVCETLKHKTPVGLVYGDCMMIDEDGKMILPSMFTHLRGEKFFVPSGNVFIDVVQGFYFYIQASLINMQLFKKLNYQFDSKFISEDWDWELLISRNYNIIGCAEVFAKYRKVDTSITALNWNDEKKHGVYKSNFDMLLKYIRHPFNSKNDNKIITNKLSQLFWLLYSSKNCTYKDRVIYSYKLFLVTKSFQSFLLVTKFFIIGSKTFKSLF